MFSRVFSLRVALALAIGLTEIVFLTYRADAGLEIALSSAAVTLALLVQLRYALRADAPVPADIAVFIFNWLFLDLAPKIQLISDPQRLVNTSSVTNEGVAITNLVCALFIGTFTFFYATLTSRGVRANASIAARTPQPELTAGGIAVTLFICLLIVVAAAPYAYHAIEDQAVISPGLLIIKRYLLFLPSAALLILLQETLRRPRKILFTRACIIAIFLVMLLVTENPYTEKRNALGPLYVSLLLIVFQKWFSTRTRRLLLLIGAMVLVFPAISVFTHNHNQALTDVSFAQLGERIEEHYLSINYDAWANVYTSIEIVARHGVQWGHQLLGSLLFFVPSSVWTGKPLATGIFLARYLINHYGMWFTNLSAPLVAEAYLDFGWLGVITYASILAFLVASLNSLALSSDRRANIPMALYGSMFLMFLLRGSLIVAMGFAVAAFLSFTTASALLSMNLGAQRRQSPPAVGRPPSTTPRPRGLSHGLQP